MKILILTQYFWPEEFIINNLAIGLRDRQHEVEVLTGLPNYPIGKFFSGYGFAGPYRDEYQGIRIFRTPLISRGKAKGWRLAINYCSFAFFACWRGLWLCRRKYDFLLVFEPSPITVGIPARLIKKLCGAKILFWVQDLWPESISATGEFRSPFLLRRIGALTSWVYRGCDLILLQSRAFYDSVLKNGALAEQVRFFPNFAEELFQPFDPSVDMPERKLLPDGFRIMFAGNIGVSQDFKTVLSAVELSLINPDIHWVILGDGRERSWLENEIKLRNLKNVHLLGIHAKERMPMFFALADVMLVSLKRDPIFELTVPSKIQAYLACGKAILVSMDGEGARIVEEADAGLTVPAESPRDLADAVLRMAGFSKARIREMEKNAREYYEKYFLLKYRLDDMDRWMSELSSKNNRDVA